MTSKPLHQFEVIFETKTKHQVTKLIFARDRDDAVAFTKKTFRHCLAKVLQAHKRALTKSDVALRHARELGLPVIEIALPKQPPSDAIGYITQADEWADWPADVDQVEAKKTISEAFLAGRPVFW